MESVAINFVTILTSAVVATLVSSSFLLLNGWRERKSRQKELFIKLAFELASHKQKFDLEAAKVKGKDPEHIEDPIFTVGRYYDMIKIMQKHNRIPWEILNATPEELKEIGKQYFKKI